MGLAWRIERGDNKRGPRCLSSLFLRRIVCFFLCFFWLLLFLTVFVFKFVVFPGAVIEWSDGGIARVEDDVVVVGIELGAMDVSAGGLEGIEKKAGGFVFDLAGEEQAHDFHESDLDGVGVFEDGQGERAWAAAGAVGSEADALVVIALVKETEAIAAERGRSALDAVDFDVLAAIGISGHCGSYPLPWWSCGIIGLAGNSILIYGLQQDAGKILRGKELVLPIARFHAKLLLGLERVLAEEKFSVKVE